MHPRDSETSLTGCWLLPVNRAISQSAQSVEKFRDQVHLIRPNELVNLNAGPT